jgi:integrase
MAGFTRILTAAAAYLRPGGHIVIIIRHYSATELLSGGVDLRTVAGRLGHGGGGATTLRVYAAWVAASDRKAAELLGSRLPKRRPTT